MLRKLFTILFLSFSLNAVAQSTPPQTTSNTEIARRNPAIKTANNKRIRYILKPNTKKTVYGNPCVLEVTRNKGFEYMVTLKGQQGYESELQRAFHNFGVNVALLFRNGPFWKFGLSRQIDLCRKKSGDYVGP